MREEKKQVVKDSIDLSFIFNEHSLNFVSLSNFNFYIPKIVKILNLLFSFTYLPFLIP